MASTPDVKLLVCFGPCSGKKIKVREGTMLMGRDVHCQIRLDDEEASRSHAIIINHRGNLRVQDLGSTNGTYVNGDRVNGQSDVRDGDQIRIGSFMFSVSITAADSGAVPSHAAPTREAAPV